MASLTAAKVKSLMHLTDGNISDTNMEYVIDQAINELNLEGNLDLPNMGGTAGSKTVSLESREAGAVQRVARVIYYSFYKKLGSGGLSGMTASSPDLASDPTVQQAVKEAARRLVEIDVGYG